MAVTGDWGVLLSHANDFENHSLERDRWLAILRDEFRASGVKPITCRFGSCELDRGWVSTVVQDEQAVLLTHGDVVDIAARRLRDQIIDIPTPRYASIVASSSSLLCHIVLMYRPGTGHVAISPLDLLGSIRRLPPIALHIRKPAARTSQGRLALHALADACTSGW